MKGSASAVDLPVDSLPRAPSRTVFCRREGGLLRPAMFTPRACWEYSVTAVAQKPLCVRAPPTPAVVSQLQGPLDAPAEGTVRPVPR
ncbi:hypothetical protein SKAU_G00247700 [Synaphobranchus kaupii]|uniref:Uncharacterized protein n=1 Tax=Synaphobranchus kaupii TaxID=118154 RepID=A0A9Q1IRK0_SYNKA|nr:hypothetical protein SKAU_G00247700 [Synaphobranchus kaupii]